MALGRQYSKSVVFILGAREGGQAALRGTGFIVGFPSEADPDQGHAYVVTAAHVVRPLATSLVRMTSADGSIVDRAVDPWVFHETEDIAVTRLPGPYRDFDFVAIPPKEFVGAEELQWSPQPGAEVFVTGLLGRVPSMGEHNVPMVRTGAIGAMYQDGIPLCLGEKTFIDVHGHLIDCQSFGGFSGSPCFVRYISARGETERMGLAYPIQSTLLLGMVGGHFDLSASVTLPDQEGKLNVPVAAGIAVIYTAEMIRELLDAEPFPAERRELEEEIAGSDKAG